MARISFLSVVALFLTGLAVPAANSAETPTRTRLTVVISTTSDWTVIKLSPGAKLAERQVRVGGGTASLLGDGWSLKRSAAASSATMETDFVLGEPAGASSFTFTIDKGYIGRTTLAVTNTTTAGKPFTVVKTVNSTQDPSRSNNRTTVKRSRSEVFGPVDLALPKADTSRLVLAAYYPWFGEDAYADPLLADKPVHPRSTYKASDVLSMTRQARAHGVNGFLVSWAGAAHGGHGFDLALQAAATTAGVVTPYLETAEAKSTLSGGSPDAGVVAQWLREALDRSSNPAFLRSGGIPVVFVYSMTLLGPEVWKNILGGLAAEGRAVRLVGDAPPDRYSAVLWGWHQYNANGELEAMKRSNWWNSSKLRANSAVHENLKPRLYVGTVSPGYDDQALRGDTNPVVPRGPEGERYLGNWSSALHGQPDWILVTSWNEWFEGTQIEPGVKTGDLALRQTAAQVSSWKSR